MTTLLPSSEQSILSLSAEWQSALAQQIAKGENVQSAFEVDLDNKLHFVKGLIVVTDQAILSQPAGETEWKRWAFEPGLQLKHHDHAGVGHLQLTNQQGLLASWRFTLGQNLHAIRLLDHFKEQLDSFVTGQPVQRAEQNTCPSCKAVLEADQEECPVCTKVIYTPPSTWTLLRLWRFARPYRLQLFIGFTDRKSVV